MTARTESTHTHTHARTHRGEYTAGKHCNNGTVCVRVCACACACVAHRHAVALAPPQLLQAQMHRTTQLATCGCHLPIRARRLVGAVAVVAGSCRRWQWHPVAMGRRCLGLGLGLCCSHPRQLWRQRTARDRPRRAVPGARVSVTTPIACRSVVASAGRRGSAANHAAVAQRDHGWHAARFVVDVGAGRRQQADDQRHARARGGVVRNPTVRVRRTRVETVRRRVKHAAVANGWPAAGSTGWACTWGAGAW